MDTKQAHSKNVQQQVSTSHHQKTKSEGGPSAYAKTHYGSSGQAVTSAGPIYHLPQQQSPFVDYQRFLEDEKRKPPNLVTDAVVFQNQKPKSHVGYYSMGPTPSNIGLVRPIQQSKSPDLSLQIKAAHYKSQKHHQNILAGSAVPILVQQQNVISQSALASYSNVQTNLLQQNSNRGSNGPSQPGNSSQVTRPSSRKKQSSSQGGQNVNGQNLIYDQSLYQQSHNSNPLQGIFIPKSGNQSALAGGYSKALHKLDDATGPSHKTIEGPPKGEHFNEQSNYLHEDPLMKSSNPQLHGNSQIGNSAKAKQQYHQYSSLQDESYYDASVYDQFIQGPHNISQFTAPGGGASGNKILDDMNSYSQYIQRPLSQNTNIGKGTASKLPGRQSPAGSQKGSSTRAVNAQMHNSANSGTHSKKAQRTAGMMHSSLNSSGQKQQILAHDRRLVVGRTPSPNFLKRIAGLMNIGNDFILPQSNNMLLYKNANNSNLLAGVAVQSKRSQSKQAFSSNPSTSLQPPLQQPIQQNFIHVGSNTIHTLDKSLKQKFAKQQNTASNASAPNQILTLGTASRFKSGSLTTSNNTAQNSPRRDVSSQHVQRNQAKHHKTTGKAAGNQSVIYGSNTDFLAEAAKKGQISQVLHAAGAINPQQKLKLINEIEEKKALALVKGIKDYSGASAMQQKQMLHQSSIQQQLQQQQQYLQQQFMQPVKMIGEIMEEDPQPLSSHEFMDEEKSFSSDPQNYYPIHGKSKSGAKPKQGSQSVLGGGPAPLHLATHKKNSKSISHPNNSTHMIDGGTGSNGIANHILSGPDAYSTQPRQIASSLNNNPSDPNNSISLYLEQLQNLRQNQKSQLSNHAPSSSVAPIIGSQAMSPMVNKTANQFFNQKQSSQPGINLKQIPFMIGGGPPQINIKPLLQSQPKTKEQEAKATLNDSNRGLGNTGGKKKGANSSDPPKIIPPSVEMYNQLQHVQSAVVGNQKKYGGPSSDVSNKTPFERELDMKTIEIKSQKKMLMPTQEQMKLQKYKEDSISILKELQESGNIVISDMMTDGAAKHADAMHSKKNSVDSKQRLVIDMAGQKKKGIVNNDQKAHHGVNSPKVPQRPNTTLVDEEDEEILITQEEEQQIKDIVSDLNHKAFYGKNLRRPKEYDYGDDEQLKKLSPRSREITMVIRMIQSSFAENNQPPVTTTDFYRIGKMLGRGAFGKVNLAMHKLVRKLVAIKSLNKECLTDEVQKQKLMKEVSLLLKLRHNHVVKIYETIETEKHIIIVMELCAGGDLLNYVRKRRRLKEPYAKVIFKQIIDGLCYIHSKFIAHRDIKLDNILLDGKGNVKIADFGVSKQCQKGQQRMTEQCGTPAYIAPEILKDKGYTFSVDLWSAGVVLFAMLYGTVPFKANNMEELHKLIVKGKYVLKDDITIEARNLLRGLLEVNPEKRLTIKQIYRHKWFEDLDPTLQLFNDQERDMIRKEYTYNDPRRYNRNENEEPVDCFTEHNLESVYNSLKNVTSKSIILAPFNSTQSQIMEEGKLRESVQSLVCEKMIVLKFARRCREIDRQYEFNNNGELDNGVYHKFINNTEEQDDSGDERANMEDVDKDLLCIPMLMSTRQSHDDDNMRRMQERQALAQKIKDGSTLQKEIQRNRKNLENEIDPELVQTLEEFQNRNSNRVDEEKITKLVQHGYPRDYVAKSLEDNEPNYCTAGYYLMGMDQNYC